MKPELGALAPMRSQLGTMQNVEELVVGGRLRVQARGVTGTGRSPVWRANRRSTDQTNKQSVFMPLLVHPLWARGVRLRTFAMVRDDVRRSHGFCGAGCMALRQRLGSQRRPSANILALTKSATLLDGIRSD
jgi:hypothetical protein